MVDNFGLQEIWLPSEETLASSKGPALPSKADSAKRVVFGSQSLSRSGYQSHLDDERRSMDGDSRSDDSESRIYFRSPSRAGLFTVDEFDVPRIVPESMQKQARANIFLSTNFYDCERLLVVVQGAGMIRPGQWSRSLCITHSIHAGSILDYLYLAKEMNMGVIVLNPNQNELKLRIRALDPPGVGIMSAQHIYGVPGHNTHISHILTVFDDFIERSKAKELYFVGNGRGGDTILQLLNHRLEGTPLAPPNALLGSSSSASSSFSSSTTTTRTPGPVLRSKRTTKTRGNGLIERLKKIAFINSAHTRAYGNSEKVRTILAERSVHWVLSPLPLDTVVPEADDMFGCTCVSAGHSKADFAAACTPNSVFRFFFGNEASSDNNSSTDNAAPETPGIAAPTKFTPRIIPFSNPPQLGNGEYSRKSQRRAHKSEDIGADLDSSDDSDVGTSETKSNTSRGMIGRTRRASIHSTSSSTTATPRFTDPPLLHSSVSRSSTMHRTESTSTSYEGNVHPVHWARRRYKQGDEKFDPLIDLVEMVEMGTQTDPQNRSTTNASPLRESNGLSTLLNQMYPPVETQPPSHDEPPHIVIAPPTLPSPVPRDLIICSCPVCRISNWILSSRTSCCLLLAVVTAGAIIGRHLLLKRQKRILHLLN